MINSEKYFKYFFLLNWKYIGLSKGIIFTIFSDFSKHFTKPQCYLFQGVYASTFRD